ncbi:MAG: CfrBI family restriction endonuclease [Bacteroidetes bacterium]|nr:MAG: CfrBI family restriction endonuclease [Bacteroidota bacterium]
MDWENLLHVFMAIGAQTLTIRGSEKSVYGKLFERLVLGSILSMFGFELIDKNDTTKSQMVFWLTEQGKKRETDATLLVRPGVGARFDIGFIGRGNTEISLDKVSRFEREMERGRQTHYMATIVLVDSIGNKSRIQEFAQAIQGNIVQMSMSFWVKEVAHILHEKINLRTDFVDTNEEDSIRLIEEKMKNIDMLKFL